MIYYLFILSIGFFLLYKGSDLFVDGSIGLAERFEIPSFVIGLTIVAMGTSLPETAVSITAALENNAEICIGNVLGSNILNVLIILGISAAIYPLAVSRKAIKYTLPFMIICSLIIYIMGADDHIITIREGAFLLFLFAFYVVLLIGFSWKNKDIVDKSKSIKLQTIIFFIVLGLVAIILGSKITTYSATNLAKMLNVSDRIIGLTIVAFGTSLPELFTSVNAARKHNANIAVANIIGSNIYNILFILGATALFTPIPFEANFVIDALINIGVGLLLLAICIQKNKITCVGGVILLVSYLGYLWWLMRTTH